MSEFFLTNLAAYTAPEVVELKNKAWVQYGVDNNYFNYIIQVNNNSTTSRAITTGVSNMIYGKGLAAHDADKRPEQYAQMMTLFKKQDLRRFISDYKILGMAAFHLVYKNGKVKEAHHFPMETLRAEKCNEDGEIEAWYYSNQWDNLKPTEKPERIPAFGYGKPNGVEMYVLKPYEAGKYYYSSPDWSSSMPYAVLEDEISDYLINDCINGFSGTKVVNFNNGVPDPDKMQSIKSDVLNKLTGSRGEKVIVAFNNNSESKTTIDDIPLNDAPAHYSYLADECFKKLIVGHRVTSPMLLGIREGNDGMGNNAEEIKTATQLFDNIVIQCFQDQVIECIDAILSINDIALDLYFKTLKPLDFTDIDIVNEEIIEEETGYELSSEKQQENILGSLLETGVKMSEEYVFVDEINEDSDINNEDWANYLIQEKKSTLSKVKGLLGLKDEITSKKNGNVFSVLDSPNGEYKIRYKYAVGSYKLSSSQRAFCRNMMRWSDAGIVWTIEDIDRATEEGVNNQLGHNGQSYDLFKFKGGVYCRHIWKRVLYRLRANTEESNNLKDYKTTGKIPQKYNRNPWGSKQAKKAPINMPNDGHYPGVK
jgi:hypothetical protein